MKMRINKRQFQIMSIVIVGAGLLSGFQNCSKVNFASVPVVQSSTAPGAVGGAGVGATGNPDPSNPSNPGNGSGVVDPLPTPVVQPTATPTSSATPVPVSTPTPVPTPIPTATPTPQPGVGTISVVASPSVVPRGSNTQIQITSTNFTNAAYQCLDKSGNSLVKGSIDLTTQQSLPLPIDQDTKCTFIGSNVNDTSIVNVSASVAISVDCGSQVKNSGGKCVDFSCQSVVTLTADQLTSIPARTTDGICYAYKLMSGISNSSSNLTKTLDTSVLAKNHGRSSDTNLNDAPFLMGSFKGDFMLQGARSVKLAGGMSATAPILVDNFIMTGVYPKATAAPIDVRQFYRVTGTSDSPIVKDDGSSTGSIQFNSEQLPVVGYASGGTSSIAPIDITSSAAPNVMQTLDIRALDCGGSRELSDVYLLFQ